MVITTGSTDHARLLDRARGALGFDAARAKGELVVQGAGRWQGMAATVSQRYHADGRVAGRVDARLGGASGFDGERGWAVDMTGWPGPCELEDLEALRVLGAVWTGRWLLPAADVEVLGVDEGAGRPVLTLALRGGASRFLLSLDAGSGLPRRLEQVAGYERAWLFDDYGPGPWGKLARRLVSKEGWLQDEMTITQIADGAGEGEAYRAPKTGGEGTSFDETAGASVVASLSPRGRLPLVQVQIDGRDVGPFLLDTGAGMMGVEARVADAAGLERCGRMWVQTAADGEGACFRVGTSLRLGPLSIARPVFVELDLTHLSRALGVRLAGVCGYDVFARAAVSIRAAPLAVSLRPRGSEQAGLAWQPLAFEGRRPLVRCEGERGEALLAIDSGSSFGAVLYGAGAARWGLAGGGGRALRAGALAGSRRVTTRRLAWLNVAGRRLEGVSVALSLEREGLAGCPNKFGVVGWGLLKRLDPVFDYARGRVAFRGQG
jgi:aspartyl protease